MKKCRRCLQEKDLSEFYKHPQMYDGFLNVCKACIRSRVSDYSQTEKGRLTEQRRNQKDGRREYRKQKLIEYRNKFRQRSLAHSKVQYALRAGKLIKKPCGVCGSEKSEAHHEDYDKPLDVMWLCRIHHRQRDKELGKYPKKYAVS